MNREILFRGKRIDDEKWEYGSLIRFADGTCEISVPEDDVSMRTCTVIEESCGQYTGLTDKNGIRIFEGDILKNAEDDIGIVKFMPKHSAFMIHVKSENRCCYLWYNNFSQIDVIGNIHDNPELLERSAQ